MTAWQELGRWIVGDSDKTLEEIIKMDEIDVAQRRQQEEIDHALAARKPDIYDTEECLECGEPLPEVRIQHGFGLCVDCQETKELRR